MASIKVNCLALGVACLWALSAQAQEPMWRGLNPDESTVVPAYAGNLSPFPVAQPEATLLPPPVFTEPTLTEADRQAIEAASILTEVRQALKEDAAFAPDLTLVAVKAVTIGPKGATVLIGDKWYKAKDMLFVPMMQNNNLIDLVTRLQALDPNLAGVVREEISGRVLSQGPAAMRLTNITREAVEVTDPEGKTIKLPFVTAGW